MIALALYGQFMTKRYSIVCFVGGGGVQDMSTALLA
jgi:hypothetical protein